MRHDHRKCEDEDDAARMAEGIMRQLGYAEVQRGANRLDVNAQLGPVALRSIAQLAERITKWARQELRR